MLLPRRPLSRSRVAACMHEPVYQEIAPPADLADVVRCFWMFRAALPAEAPAERIVPDGQPELIWHFGDPDSVASADGQASAATCTGPLFAGQLTRPLLLGLGRDNDNFGIRLRPAGATRLGLPPQRELANQRIGLRDVLPGPLRNVFLALEHHGRPLHFAARVRLACVALRAALARGAEQRASAVPALIVADLAGRIDADDGRTRVRELSRVAGWSERHLQREFARVIGVTPKMYGRIVRFRAACRAMRAQVDDGATGPRWTAAAASSGYFDQPHLVHDFRQFAGLTPTEFLATLTPLNAAILAAD